MRRHRALPPDAVRLMARPDSRVECVRRPSADEGRVAACEYYGKAWREAAPFAEWKTVPGAGHVPNYDEPELIAEQIIAAAIIQIDHRIRAHSRGWVVSRGHVASSSPYCGELARDRCCRPRSTEASQKRPDNTGATAAP